MMRARTLAAATFLIAILILVFAVEYFRSLDQSYRDRRDVPANTAENVTPDVAHPENDSSPGTKSAPNDAQVDTPSPTDYETDGPAEPSTPMDSQALLRSILGLRDEEAVRILEEWLSNNPDEQGKADVLIAAAARYLQLERLEDMKRALQEARERTRDDTTINLIDLYLAEAYIAEGADDAAMETLIDVWTRPVPDAMDTPLAMVYQLFDAPRTLAKLYERQGHIQDADETLANMADAAYELATEHPEYEWPDSYLAHAYINRIDLVYRNTPENIDLARELLEEARSRIRHRSIGVSSAIINQERFISEVWQRRLNEAQDMQDAVE